MLLYSNRVPGSKPSGASRIRSIPSSGVRCLDPALPEARRVGEARDAGLLCEQVADRDLRPGRRRLGVVPGDGIVEAEPAALDEPEDGDRGEGFGDRADAEFCVGRVGKAPLAVGEAEALAEDRLAVERDEHCAAEAVALDIALHDRLGMRREAGIGGCRRDEEQQAENQERSHHRISPLTGRRGRSRRGWRQPSRER